MSGNGGLTLEPAAVAAFRRTVCDHYSRNRRPMPWRETDDPYAILVSEVMLQQTQVERVKVKYAEFLAVFPTVQVLAEASLQSVLQMWQGLGYNRRAVNLKKCAEVVVSEYGGCFPRTTAGLCELPGIGPYTAGAVAAFAFGVATPFIETNIRSVFIHSFFHGRDDVRDSELMPLIEITMDRENPRDWYYALMDYGTLIKQSVPNPGRCSRHHVRQSRFEGSNRQLRSRLLKLILGQPGITGLALVSETAAQAASVRDNLEALTREGFLVKRGRRFYISEKTHKG